MFVFVVSIGDHIEKIFSGDNFVGLYEYVSSQVLLEDSTEEEENSFSYSSFWNTVYQNKHPMHLSGKKQDIFVQPLEVER